MSNLNEKLLRRITEADIEKKPFMSRKEILLRKKLCNLLRDDGKGHHHAKYAARLEKFDINIVSLEVDPDFTAAISFDEGVIFIGEGFLHDESTFFQLNVLMRHELAHNLLMHQIRMMHKIGENPYSHIKMSASIHELLNIIEDYEISNRKYSEEDKRIVRNMWLNGRVIGGLVTEDDRDGWLNMSVEEMYDELNKDIDNLHQEILNGWALNTFVASPDPITRSAAAAMAYMDTKSPSIINNPVEEFIKHSKKFKKMHKSYQDIVISLVDQFKDKSDAEKQTAMDTIAKSKPTEEVTVGTVHLYIPEEKYLAVAVFKNLIGNWEKAKLKIILKQARNSQDYKDMYNKIIKEFDNDSVTTSDLYAGINAASARALGGTTRTI